MKEFLQVHTDDWVSFVSDLSFPAHLHSVVELVYIWQGESSAVVDGNEYQLAEGDLLFVSPNSVHSYTDKCVGKYFFVIFSCESIPLFCETLQNGIQSHKIENERISDSVKTLLALLVRKRDGSKEWFSGIVTALLAEILPLIPQEKKKTGDGIREILDYCLLHYREPITLETISTEIHISASRISHIFKERIGLTFKYYVNSLRIREACALLSSSEESVANIALLCGFESIRSFNRNFLHMMGTTPKGYRQSCSEKEHRA